MKKKEQPKMLTVREAAQQIGAAQVSVRIWASQGRFPGAHKESTPFGDFWMIPESALDGFQMGRPGPKLGSKRKNKIGR
jgi:hypothetical protein